MRRNLLILCLFLAFTCSGYGLSGGPFGGGAADASGGEGTYQGVFTGNNLIGIAAFSWSNSSSSTGRWAFFHKGFVRFGNMEAVVNLPGRQVAGVFEGGVALDATGAFQASITTTAPLIRFEGTGRVHSPANPVTTTTVTSTVDVTTTTSTDIENGNITTNTTTIVTDDTTQSSLETDPFRIQGVRTSVQAANFGPVDVAP